MKHQIEAGKVMCTPMTGILHMQLRIRTTVTMHTLKQKINREQYKTEEYSTVSRTVQRTLHADEQYNHAHQRSINHSVLVQVYFLV